MVLDQTTSILFRKTPRDIGRPERRKVFTFQDFENFVEMQNGLSHVFVSLYDDTKKIDKIWFDIDAKSLEESLQSAKDLYKRLKEKKLDFYVIFSGSKGFHFYILLEEYTPPNLETARVLISQAHEQLAGNVTNIDSQPKGDISRLVRVPGTLHPKTGKYCTFIPEDFINWNVKQIVGYARSFHGDKLKPRYKLDKIVDFNKVYRSTNIHEYKFDAQSHHIPENVIKMLEPLIRPCVLQILKSDREPPHAIRTTFVSELVWLGYDAKDISEICAKLNWIDYDKGVTNYHVKKLVEKKLFPTSTEKIHQLINCHCDHDDWWYSIGDKK